MPILGCGKLSRCDIRRRKNLDLGILVLYLCFAKQMKKQYYLLIHSAFFDIVLQQKVRQVGLSETRDAL